MENLENIFGVLHYGDQQQIDLAVFQFEGAARHWWGNVSARWTRAGTERTWANFKEEFLNKFVPRLVREGRRDEFARLEQGNRSVAEYDAEFTRLLRYVPHFQNDEREKARLFIRGLNSNLQFSLIGVEMSTYATEIGRAHV